MQPRDLEELLQGQPFRPFRITLTNNATHEIRHPEFAQLSHRLLLIGVPEASEGSEEQSFIGVAIVHIVQYEFLPPAAS
jgi:hypothetical protein